MNSEARNVDSAMARKIAQSGQGAVQSTRPLLRALRRGLAQASAHVAGPAMAVIGATENRFPRDLLSTHLEEQRLMLVLGEPGGLTAAICVDRQATAAMIRYQTIGEVGSQPPDERPFTETDAALLAPLAEQVLVEAGALLGEAEEWLCLQRYRFESRQKKISDLVLAMGQEHYRLCDLVVDIGHGACQGQITVVLPDEVEEQDAQPSEAASQPAGLERNFGLMRTELRAVLTRLHVPLSVLSGLKPGDTLPLESCPLDEAELLTIDGRALARARLGQCRGMRALRLNETSPEPYSNPTDVEVFDDLSQPAQDAPVPTAITPPSTEPVLQEAIGPARQEGVRPGTDIASMPQSPQG
ncbi:FliM/FliN family flagellar motor switch protein [Ruegeria sp. 2205SS24-7]|uniref:flagellar motor switch protein FliM n=1 Tax=Ruegeria discodermiae TaxID=3064389 RepID=UPI0027412859|nr:flagellar motor switch protein FliM [Ruegeria sp. 2205SS24-7]MDP5220309.1 FliM/FliN family flagellar motor switch protein [Ruegeria sp. 2205SS24-7]